MAVKKEETGNKPGAENASEKGRPAASRQTTKPPTSKSQAKANPDKRPPGEKPQPACRIRSDAPVGKLEFSRLDKVLFPKDGFTKSDLIEYYRQVAEVMLPHITGRPTSMQRWPEGIHGFNFYQKETPDYFPDWIEQVEVEKKATLKDPDHWQCQIICDKPETLMYLANQACITVHTWLSRKPNIDQPDRIVFDLDPSVENFEAIKQGARDMRALLEKLGLPSFLMATGSRGLHVVVPVKPEFDFDVIKPFTKKISEMLVAQNPDAYTVEHRKAKRGDRIFVDYLRNEYAQTAVPPYAVRAKDGAPVATPLEWKELDEQKLSAQRYNIQSVITRLEKTGDPWADMQKEAVSLKTLVEKFS